MGQGLWSLERIDLGTFHFHLRKFTKFTGKIRSAQQLVQESYTQYLLSCKRFIVIQKSKKIQVQTLER